MKKVSLTEHYPYLIMADVFGRMLMYDKGFLIANVKYQFNTERLDIIPRVWNAIRFGVRM